KRTYMGLDKIFCDLINNKDDHGAKKKNIGVILHLMALKHCSHICGWSAIVPTVSLQFQQRSHFFPGALSTFIKRPLISVLSYAPGAAWSKGCKSTSDTIKSEGRKSL